MKQLFIFLVFIFFTHQLLAQFHAPIKIIDYETKKPVSFAMVQNRMADVSIVCDAEGFGIIPVKDSTLLKISAISYEDYFRFIIYSEELDTIKIIMKHKTYELKELVVHPHPTRMLFKKAIADLMIPDTNSVSANLFMVSNLKGYSEQAKSYQESDFITISLGAPITGMYNLLSKREHSKRKLKKLQWNDTKAHYIQKRYNKTYVEKLLGIREMKKIKAFMEYCQPEYDFLIAATDYELACYVLNCYQSFLLNEPDME